MAEAMLEPGQRPVAKDSSYEIEGWSLSRDGFVLRPCGRPFMIEIFAGSATEASTHGPSIGVVGVFNLKRRPSSA